MLISLRRDTSVKILEKIINPKPIHEHNNKCALSINVRYFANQKIIYVRQKKKKHNNK